jgi:drug/metabolite transporter (DMT)-like permease
MARILQPFGPTLCSLDQRGQSMALREHEGRMAAQPNATAQRPAVPVWVSFISLSLIWGSSFLFIKIGLDQGLPPLALVSYRLLIAVLFLVVLLRLTHGRLPRSREAWWRLTVLGFINVALPFCLITWGEQYTSSAIASILNALTPLFTIFIASLVLHDEPIRLNAMTGVLIGFGGAVLLTSPSIGAAPGAGGTSELVGELAIAAGALSYAFGAVFARHQITGRKLIDDPVAGPRTPSAVEIALPQALVSGSMVTVVALITQLGQPHPVLAPPTPQAWLAVLWLGLLGSGVAHVLMFTIIRWWGAGRATLVTYLMPVVGIALGVAILGETLLAIEFLGALLIIGGLLVANSRYGRRQLYGRAASATATETLQTR